jgi:hypothetical protein
VLRGRVRLERRLVVVLLVHEEHARVVDAPRRPERAAARLLPGLCGEREQRPLDALLVAGPPPSATGTCSPVTRPSMRWAGERLHERVRAELPGPAPAPRHRADARARDPGGPAFRAASASGILRSSTVVDLNPARSRRRPGAWFVSDHEPAAPPETSRARSRRPALHGTSTAAPRKRRSSRTRSRSG